MSSIECPRCNKVIHRDSIREHIDVVHFNRNKFQCELCDYKASRYGRIMQHKRYVHNQKIDPKFEKSVKSKKLERQCSYCGVMIMNWRRHILKIHMNIKNFFCDCCKYSSFFKSDLGESALKSLKLDPDYFTTEKHMKRHIKKPKEPKEPQKFCCDKCGLNFDNRYYMNTHMKSKHSERIYKCKVCEKSKLHSSSTRSTKFKMTYTFFYSIFFIPESQEAHRVS